MLWGQHSKEWCTLFPKHHQDQLLPYPLSFLFLIILQDTGLLNSFFVLIDSPVRCLLHLPALRLHLNISVSDSRLSIPHLPPLSLFISLSLAPF